MPAGRGKVYSVQEITRAKLSPNNLKYNELVYLTIFGT